MNRIQKIKRLAEVGFSATELHRMSNLLLDSTYQAAQPLMAAHAEELRRVISRENTAAARVRAMVVEQQKDRKAQEEWSRKWKPLPPICTIDRTQCDGILTQYISEFRTNTGLYRKSGHACYRDRANLALRKMRHISNAILEEVR